MNGTLSGFLISGLFSFKVSFLAIDLIGSGDLAFHKIVFVSSFR